MIFADNMKFERNREIVKQEMRAIQNACRKEKRVYSIWSSTRGKINKPNNGKLSGREKFYTKH